MHHTVVYVLVLLALGISHARYLDKYQDTGEDIPINDRVENEPNEDFVVSSGKNTLQREGTVTIEKHNGLLK